MTREEFDSLFDDTIENILKNDFSESKIQERVSAFSDEQMGMSLDQMSEYLTIESRIYINSLIYDLFSAIAVND